MKLLLSLILLFTLPSFAKDRCFVMPMPSEDGSKLIISFFNKNSDLVKLINKDSFSGTSKRCDKAFFEYIENPENEFDAGVLNKESGKSTKVVFVFDEANNNKIKFKKKFLKRLDDLEKKTELKIIREENGNYLKIEVTK